MTTKGASFSYEEVIDLHTESDRVTVIGIHTPTSDTPRRMAPGLFSQFRKFKYLGCSVTMVPAATLPVDPLGVSYEAGEPTVDPRDMLNPILFHGCHGNDLGNILNRIYASNSVEGSDMSQLLHTDSATLWSMLNEEGENPDDPFFLSTLESLYYRALTDRTWQKANIQRGFRKTGLHPRIYTLATNMQLQNAQSLGASQFPAPAPFEGQKVNGTYFDYWDFDDSTANPVRFFTPRTQRLGWLDTRQVVPYTSQGHVTTPLASLAIDDIVKHAEIDTKLPRIYMGVILLPPAYKQEQYFRMIVTHRFAFAGFRGISMSNLELENPNYFNLNQRITDEDSDPPEPEPDPDPEPPVPTPTYDVRLSGRNSWGRFKVGEHITNGQVDMTITCPDIGPVGIVESAEINAEQTSRRGIIGDSTNYPCAYLKGGYLIIRTSATDFDEYQTVLVPQCIGALQSKFRLTVTGNPTYEAFVDFFNSRSVEFE